MGDYRFCSQCGSPIAEGEKFCQVCGGLVDTWQEEAKQSTDIQQTTATNVQQPTMTSGEQAAPTNVQQPTVTSGEQFTQMNTQNVTQTGEQQFTQSNNQFGMGYDQNRWGYNQNNQEQAQAQYSHGYNQNNQTQNNQTQNNQEYNQNSQAQYSQEYYQGMPNSTAGSAEKSSVQPAPKKRNLGAIIGICAGCGIVAAVAIAVGVLFLSGKLGSAPSNNLAEGAGTEADVVDNNSGGDADADGDVAANSDADAADDNADDGDSATTNDADSADEGDDAADSDEDILTRLNVREDILSAMEASKKLSGQSFAMASDGGYYYRSSCVNFAYSYYGKDVTGLYADASSDPIVVATMEDGSVYAGMTLIAEDCDIIDVAFKTHNTNIDAYMLGSDGQLYYFDPYNETDDGRYENYFEKVEGATNISAICRAQSYPIFFYADGGVATPGIFMSGGSAEWQNVDVSEWEGIVVAACAYDDDDDIYTIAGISADGTVYATGNYAEDILAMGDLVYITMTDTASLIVGLTPEGTLKFAGRSGYVEYYNNLELNNIAGVKAFEGNVWAIGTDGTVYELSVEEDEEADDETYVAVYTGYSTDGISGEYAFRVYYMSASGEVYEEDDAVWAATDSINAQTADAENILYYNTLITGKYNAGRSFTSSTYELSEDNRIAVMDLNGDGLKELIVEKWNIYYILCPYDEEVSTSVILYGSELQYYEELQLLVIASYGSEAVSYEAGYLINGQYTKTFSWTETYDGTYMYCYYFGDEELPYTDEDGESLREGNENCVSSAEFTELWKMIVGDAVPQTVSELEDYSEDNLATVLGIE